MGWEGKGRGVVGEVGWSWKRKRVGWEWELKREVGGMVGVGEGWVILSRREKGYKKYHSILLKLTKLSFFFTNLLNYNDQFYVCMD